MAGESRDQAGLVRWQHRNGSPAYCLGGFRKCCPASMTTSDATRPSQTRHLLGRQVLQSIRAELAQYQDRIAASNTRVSVIRFVAGRSYTPLWRRRMEASRISAEQKAKAFTFLGYRVDEKSAARMR
jgi:hypothetical protein